MTFPPRGLSRMCESVQNRGGSRNREEVTRGKMSRDVIPRKREVPERAYAWCGHASACVYACALAATRGDCVRDSTSRTNCA